jgi:divalent metal cation (Fe/Co/Zn/Cd) transporter
MDAPVDPQLQRRYELTELYRIERLATWTLLPVAAAAAVAAGQTGSVTVLSLALQGAVAAAAGFFQLYALRRAVKANAFSFPYGAGKFDDFGRFLRGALLVPAALVVVYCAIVRLIRPVDVGYMEATIAAAAALARAFLLLVEKRRLLATSPHPSAQLRNAYAVRRSLTVNSVVIVVVLVIGLALEDAGVLSIGERVDPILALFVAWYMADEGVRLTLRHFGALVDRPLPPGQRQVVDEVLARYAAECGGALRASTRASGVERFVDIDIRFLDDRTLAAAEGVGERIRGELAEALGETHVRLFVAEEAGAS